jgi:phosphatidylglycerophosphate synthase
MSRQTFSLKWVAKAPQKLWWLSLIVFGPITVMLVNFYIASVKADRPVLAAGSITALATFWMAAPALLHTELSMLLAAVRT